MSSLTNNLRWVRKEWMRNHRHHGGLPAFLRCALGSMNIHRVQDNYGNKNHRLLDVITFSVVPDMTALWAVCMDQVLMDFDSARILIGDCTGGYIPHLPSTRTRIFPLLNFPHGLKLDWFLTKVCQAEYVVISDDDVFWMDDASMRWALDLFKQDEQLAVVSFIPRTHVSSVLGEKVTRPMGSHCLILRRDIWLRENLTFQIVYPSKEEDYDWFYDTGDYANVQLLERGYKVITASPEFQNDFIVFDGISTWTLKIQENGGYIRSHLLGDVQLRSEKALNTVLVLRGIDELIRIYFSPVGRFRKVLSEHLLIAEKSCGEFLSMKKQKEIYDSADLRMGKLSLKLKQIIDDGK